MRRTNAKNPFFFFSRTTAKKKWRPFSLISVSDLCWRKRHERHQQKHETTRRRTTHVMILLTRRLPHRQVLFLMLCFCVCAVRVFFSKALFCFTPESDYAFAEYFESLCVDLSEDVARTTQNCTTQRISSAFRRTTQTSLSLCVCSLCFCRLLKVLPPF